MWDRYPARPATVGAPTSKPTKPNGGGSGNGSGYGSGNGRGNGQGGSQLVEGATMGPGGGAGGAGGRSQRATSMAPFGNSNLNSSPNGQKKLTPPPQLHERGFLKGQRYRQSQLQPRTQSLSVSTSGLSQQERQPHQLLQHLSQQRGEQQTGTQQHLRLHLRGGQTAQGSHHHQNQGQGQGQGQGQAQQLGRGSSVRNNFPYANSNRDASPPAANAAAAAAGLNSTSTLHHQNFWPDDFRNPNGGLGIEHNLPSPTTPPKNEKRALGRIESPQDRDATRYRHATSITSQQRDETFLLPPPAPPPRQKLKLKLKPYRPSRRDRRCFSRNPAEAILPNGHHPDPTSAYTMAAATSSSRLLLAHRDFSRNLNIIASSLLTAVANVSPCSAIEDLLPPPSLTRHDLDSNGKSNSWRPTSSVYSLKRDSYSSPVSPNFANVAARNTYVSAVADISPPSSPDMDARRDGNRTQDRNVSPIEESPDMSQLSLENSHGGQNGTPPPKSNIPMMRRERRKNQDAAAHTLRETKSQQRLRIQRETRWDDMTGEPTSLTTGRAGQVRPQEYAQGIVNDQPFGKSPAAMRAMQNAPQTQQTFSDRLRRLRPVGGSKQQSSAAATATPPETPEERPPWRGASGLRGASGRTAIVNPVRDTAPKEPLSIPRKSSKRTAVGPRLPIAGVTSPLSPVSPSESETSPRTRTPTVRTVLNAPRQLISSPSPTASASASPSPDADAAATRTPPPAQSSYPSPPNSGSAGVQSPVLATPETTTSAPVRPRQPPSLTGLPAAPNAHLGQDKSIRRKPPPANSQALHAPQPSYSSSVYSEATVHAPSAHQRSPPRAPRSPGAALKANEPWDQPPSRFSVTTYATSAADTPRQSTDTAPPPVPALPSPQLPGDGVMSRKRPPVLGHTNNAVNADQPFVISMSSPYMSTAFADTTSPVPARSELPSQKQPLPRASTPSMYSTSSRPESVWSTSKALPPPPTETSMVNDRVGYLNARLESLGNRRININQAIKQMTELMPTDSILASEAVLRKREAEKRKVEALKIELAEVQREEYEIGLKLHRAYKRMDRNAEYEPTTLWVRRVTG
ncbi:hypothetical protein CkaCkLH20_12774 [Colletotrichum karsti]|uniref:Uncharacterized protein n=1 Tax=Colletotrichum karsti TaxID=1095194 RepID=A0A9P6LE60_9PEZI|nr:uncharacterized protein CkaCkLH20_12774 [Colletotrichum karsti]KAF9869731.1 hypothetical protein CkaCkLH20_12774 [Colletotrichum karsti]